MKTPEQAIAFLVRRIGYIYHHRPLMYGGSGAGVELSLHNYHDVFAFITERQQDFEAVLREQYDLEDCGSANFSTRFAMNHPTADELEIANYVVKQWRKVSDRMGVPIPHDEIRQELANNGIG